MRHRKNRRLALAYALIVAVELLATVLAGWAVARWAIPYAYAERGYWAVGGEWILTAGAALFALWATNHMFFGGVRNAGKVQKMPQDTYDASGGGGGVRAGMLRQGVREVVVLDLKGNTLGRFVTENTNLSLIHPYEKNPRKNDGAVAAVAESIQEFGFKVPVIVDRNNVIIAGHTRYKAALQLGLDQIPCIVAEDLNDEQIKAYRIADNKVSEAAAWDGELLRGELEQLQAMGYDLAQTGFEEFELDSILRDMSGLVLSAIFR